MHEPLVEALPGLLGAASAMGGLGGMAAIAGAHLRRKRHTSSSDAEEAATEEASDQDVASVNSP